MLLVFLPPSRHIDRENRRWGVDLLFRDRMSSERGENGEEFMCLSLPLKENRTAFAGAGRLSAAVRKTAHCQPNSEYFETDDIQLF